MVTNVRTIHGLTGNLYRRHRIRSTGTNGNGCGRMQATYTKALEGLRSSAKGKAYATAPEHANRMAAYTTNLLVFVHRITTSTTRIERYHYSYPYPQRVGSPKCRSTTAPSVMLDSGA